MANFNGKRLEQLRKAKGLSRPQLGRMLGVHRNTVYYWETGQTEVDARRIVACVNACAGVPTETLEAGPTGHVKGWFEAWSTLQKLLTQVLNA